MSKNVSSYLQICGKIKAQQKPWEIWRIGYNYKEGEDDEQEDREDGDEDHDEHQGGLGAGLDAWGIGMRWKSFFCNMILQKN